ncbi:MAG: hypothetical protein IKQ09_06185 [Bacteroidales bacterium]|nr:hypothetical protein [Bacteroidota bacterium]MBQ2188843.1 hypothetical protein [Bacteroidales bacterium]MBR6092386.1 hypothetical protein [Bacteroidales bacterium]
MYKRIFLITCMLGMMGLSYANNYVAEDNLTVLASKNGGDDKGSSITADINGNTLTVAFSQNLGEVTVEISTASGATIFCLSVQTPTGYQYFIPASGSYVVTFTLQNGNEYYAEFVISD